MNPVRPGIAMPLPCSILAFVTAFGACSGAIDRVPGQPAGPGQTPGPPTLPGTSTPGGSQPGSPAPQPPLPAVGPANGYSPDRNNPVCARVDPGPSPLRRLTHHEFANTVADLVGAGARAGLDFPAEERFLGFSNNAELRSVSPLLADRYYGAAEKVARLAVSQLGTLLTCDPQRDGEQACLDRFLDGFGRRAWRRPLEAAERDNLRRAFMQGKSPGFADGIEAVITVILLSPQFMYRLERGVPEAGSSQLRVGHWEMATRLSYTLWGSLPDEQLLTAAAGGKLGTREEVLAQAQRMVKDARAARMVESFADQWLRLEEIKDVEKDPAVYPSFTTDLRPLLRQETQQLIDQAVWKGDGKYQSLLTAPYTFVNAPLAQYYGISGAMGAGFQQVPLDATKRAGFLTQAGLLSVLGVGDGGLSSLIFRGLFVRERLLCQKVPDPPANVDDIPVMPSSTGRSWSAARLANSYCGACHSSMDSIGYGLENFDGAGNWRTTERGQPIDAHGDLANTDVAGPFNGPVEMVNRLASSKQVQECMATQWLRFSSGREEIPADACTQATLNRVFAASGGNIRDLLVALTQTDTFLYRSKGEQP